ncbi:DUF6327 family protein [Muriicola sp. E247]|uniref:DUF6327 family protein n=1 Tax=Muriicola sp. E247 TaxID=3242730 RepID=UPI003524BD58
MKTTMNKRYSSFEEIDQQLKILELQRKLDWEHIKLNTQAVKQTLSPTNFSKKIENVFLQAILGFALKKIVQIRSRRKHKEIASAA